MEFVSEGLHSLFEHRIFDELKRLISFVFKFLKMFVYKNSTNQKSMRRYFNLLTKQLDEDMGQIPLLCAIFKDNLHL